MNKVEVVAKLIAIKEIINKGWTQHALARDINGGRVGVLSTEAVCWCLTGAINVTNSVHNFMFIAIYDALEESIVDLHHIKKTVILTRFNDAENRTLTEVLQVVDHAIELQSAEN